MERKRFVKLRATAVFLQRAARRILGIKNRNAGKIQALVRGAITRKHLKNIHQSALQIQVSGEQGLVISPETFLLMIMYVIVFLRCVSDLISPNNNRPAKKIWILWKCAMHYFADPKKPTTEKNEIDRQIEWLSMHWKAWFAVIQWKLLRIPLAGEIKSIKKIARSFGRVQSR